MQHEDRIGYVGSCVKRVCFLWKEIDLSDKGDTNPWKADASHPWYQVRRQNMLPLVVVRIEESNVNNDIIAV